MSEIDPPHYASADGSDVDCMRAQLAMLGPEQMRGYWRGCAIKYLWRYLGKNKRTDLAKAQRCIELLDSLEANHDRDNIRDVVRGVGREAGRGGDAGKQSGCRYGRNASTGTDSQEVS